MERISVKIGAVKIKMFRCFMVTFFDYIIKRR